MKETVIDCIGLYCPVPIAEAATAISEVASGDSIKILADDPGVESDFPNWCKLTSNELVAINKVEDGFEIIIRKP